MPGPKPQPTNVRELYPSSHRAEFDSAATALPAEAPDEPNWLETFPAPAGRVAIAKHYGTKERLGVSSDAHLDGLNKRARAVAAATWALVVPDLKVRGMLAKVDQLALKELCVAVARIDQAEREISAKGPMLLGRDGGTVKNPALTMAKTYREQFNKLLPEFGLSPSARTRLQRGDFGTDDGDGLFD
jgi:P27 family predicted phage terminase small subunit